MGSDISFLGRMSNAQEEVDPATRTGLEVPLPEGWGEHQRRRALNMFRDYDWDGNGVIDEKDFDMLADRLSQVSGQPKDVFLQQLLQEWDALSAAADTDKNGVVDPDEWVEWRFSLMRGCRTYEDLPALLQATVDKFWGQMARGQDVMDKDTYFQTGSLIRHWIKKKETYDHHFDLMSPGGKPMDRAAFNHRVAEWWLSPDPETL